MHDDDIEEADEELETLFRELRVRRWICWSCGFVNTFDTPVNSEEAGPCGKCNADNLRVYSRQDDKDNP